MDKAEAVVVGAGPAGLLAAREIALGGVQVTVFEEHPIVGEPNHCAGLLSVEGVRRLGVDKSEDFVQHEVTGGRIYTPSGGEIEFRGKRTRAYVVDRAAFDRKLAEAAGAAGAQIETQRPVEKLLIRNSREGVEGVKGRGWKYEAKVVVDAEGAGSALAREAGIRPQTTGVLSGVNVEISADVEPHLVEVWLGNDLAPGLFAWVIPLGGGDARCGLACNSGDAFERLRKFLDRRFGGVKCSPPRRWVVLTGGPINTAYLNGLLVVGDAAGQAKPTTGGGVILGGLCAIEAGKTVVEAVKNGDCSARFLQRYQRAWQDTLGGEFRSMLAVRRLVNRLSDARVNSIFEAFKQEDVEEFLFSLVEGGDMDMQSGIIRTVLKDQRLMRIIVRGLGRLALGELRSLFNL